MKRKVGKILKNKLFPILEPVGFIVSNDGLFYIRHIEDILQGFLIFKTRYKDQYDAYLSIAEYRSFDTSELSDSFQKKFQIIEASRTRYGLSYEFPFISGNSWYFSDEKIINESINTITEIIEKFCLPVLGVITTSEKLNQSEDFQINENISESICINIADKLGLGGYKLASHKKFLWKQINENIYAILTFMVTGYNCYLYAMLALWTPLLNNLSNVIDEPPADAFIGGSFRYIEKEHIFSPERNFWFIGNSNELLDIAVNEITELVLEQEEKWLSSHNTLSDLLELGPNLLRNIVKERLGIGEPAIPAIDKNPL